MTIHDPVLRLGILAIHPFGFCAAIGIVLGYVAALWRALRANLPARYLPGLLIVVVLGGLVAARLGYVAQHPGPARDGLQGILALWRGGLSLAAGLAGGTVLLSVYTWARRESLWRWADALAPAVSLGLAAGMLGLPFGTPPEGWGQPTKGPFFMRVDPSVLPQSLLDDRRFQPIFAYEAILFAALAVVLLALSRRQRRVGRPPSGTVGLTFLFVAMLGYGGLRPLTLDASHPLFVMQTQVFCAAVAALALGALVARLWRVREEPEVTREIWTPGMRSEFPPRAGRSALTTRR